MPRPKRDIQAVAQETVHPTQTASQDLRPLPELKQSAGNNLYHLELPTSEVILAELPARFRSTIWIKRGSFVPGRYFCTRGSGETSSVARFVNVVRDEKAWRKMSYWPAEFHSESFGPMPTTLRTRDPRCRRRMMRMRKFELYSLFWSWTFGGQYLVQRPGASSSVPVRMAITVTLRQTITARELFNGTRVDVSMPIPVSPRRHRLRNGGWPLRHSRNGTLHAI